MARVSPLVLAVPVIFVGILALFTAGNFREDRDALPSVQVGSVVPDLQLSALAGKPQLDPAVLREPGVKVLNFWASWCAPCRAEHPSLTAIAESGIPVYAINYKDDPAKALAFLEELGDPFTAHGADPNGRNAIDWGVYAMPETMIIDSSGKVVHHFRGPITQRSLEGTIRPAIEAAN